MVHLDESRQGRRTVLEQVVDVGDPVSGLRVAGRRHHRAAGLEQHDDVALEDAVSLPQHREHAAARTRAVSRRDA